jgi:hypothetical protein
MFTEITNNFIHCKNAAFESAFRPVGYGIHSVAALYL